MVNATKILLKRGIDKSYVDHTEEIDGVKGKVQMSQTLKSKLLFQQKTICSFDEFSSNILANRILVTTIYNLVRTQGLDKDLKMQLLAVARMMSDIQQINLTSSLFKQVRLNRNNSYYGFVLSVCQIVHENILPSEDRGRYTFTDFTRDERKMNQLFEAFVLNFYRREQTQFHAGREDINWKLESANDESSSLLPLMKTDISLTNKTQKIIIDAKFYSKTVTSNRFGQERINSTNLYQLFSYLLNQENDDERTLTARGILLYPTIDKEYDLHYVYGRHVIEVKTLNLDANWRNIASRLREIIQVNSTLA